jgi:ribosomal protein L7Ae-like RNA K-turn-binding protein
MTPEERILNLLGLAYRSRKLICGDFAAEKHLKQHGAKLMFLAADGGSDNVKKYRYWAEKKNLMVVDIFTKEQLGGAVGKARNVVLLLTDAGFAKAIDKVLKTME